VAWFRRKKASASRDKDDLLGDRSFPTESYLTPDGFSEGYGNRYAQLQAEALAMNDGQRSERAAAADRRVVRGPTEADRDHIPYIQEAWEWAGRTARVVGLKRRKAFYGCVLDALTRMRVAALIERRNLAWPETAAKVAGVDLPWIQVEHDMPAEDFERYVSKARELLHEGLEEGWNGVVWGDIDPDDPFRTIEIDSQACRGCGLCVVLCPDAFAKSAEGDAYVTEPAAVRDPELEDCCMAALAQCPENAILLNTRGARTVTGEIPPRGRPLPGERIGQRVN